MLTDLTDREHPMLQFCMLCRHVVKFHVTQ
jgi:hypothetical protein